MLPPVRRSGVRRSSISWMDQTENTYWVPSLGGPRPSASRPAVSPCPSFELLPAVMSLNAPFPVDYNHGFRKHFGGPPCTESRTLMGATMLANTGVDALELVPLMIATVPSHRRSEHVLVRCQRPPLSSGWTCRERPV